MAAMAVEDSIRILDRDIETLNINYFQYTNPVFSGLVMKTYHGMLKRRPEVWDYLYDNDAVRERTAKFRNLLHKLNNKKIRKLLDWYKPDILVCTQAFPCVALAEYKRAQNLDMPLVGVVTDYGVHSYWADEAVDLYIVPNVEAKEKLVKLGIKNERIEILGIPIAPKFYIPLDKKKLKIKMGIDDGKPVLLIMGGSQGMVYMDEIVRHLSKIPIEMHAIVVCGVNKKLYADMRKVRAGSKLKIHLHQYVRNIEELMSVSDIIVTKPGGLTVSESLSKGLPMVIINPLPGQEAKNTEYLVRNNAAVIAKDGRDVARRISDLMSSSSNFKEMKRSVDAVARPRAGFDIAERIINWK